MNERKKPVELWRFTTRGFVEICPRSTPTTDGKAVYLLTHDMVSDKAFLYALNVATGRRLWRAEIPSRIREPAGGSAVIWNGVG
jgi:outer membrane protein assembly factor BamB